MMFARHQFELSQPVTGGVSIREHLDLVYERTGVMPEGLANAPACPASTAQLWADFLELHSSRTSNGFGFSRISWNDLVAWQTIRGAPLTAWDVDQIRALDSMWLSEFAPKGKEEE